MSEKLISGFCLLYKTVLFLYIEPGFFAILRLLCLCVSPIFRSLHEQEFGKSLANSHMVLIALQVHSHLKYLVDNHASVWASASFQELWPSPKNLKLFERYSCSEKSALSPFCLWCSGCAGVLGVLVNVPIPDSGLVFLLLSSWERDPKLKNSSIESYCFQQAMSLPVRYACPTSRGSHLGCDYSWLTWMWVTCP